MFLRNDKIAVRRLAAIVFLFVLAMIWRGAFGINDSGFAQEPRRNPEAQKLKNPEPETAESIEAGKKLYQRYCASCHGPGGKGDGGMSLSGGTPSDLTDDAWDYGSTDGEIFAAIRDGVSADMLAYKEKLNEKQIWQIVTFIRSIGPKPKDEK